MTASNSTLRLHAFALYKKHWRTLLLIALVTAIPSGILILFTHFFPITVTANRIVAFLFNLLLYPITTIGTANVFLTVWRGQTPKVSALFHFCSSSRLWLRTLLLGFVVQLTSQVFLFPYEIRGLFSDNGTISIVWGFFAIICAIFFFWLTLRLALLPYLYNTEYAQKSTWAIIKDAFFRMKGSVGRFIWFMITVVWLLGLVIVLVWAIFRGVSHDSFWDTLNSTTQFLMLTVFIRLFLLLWIPYIELALAGFANEYIAPENPEPEEDALPQRQCPACGEQIDFDYARCPACRTRLL